jgi:hypothetical protein
MVLVREPCDLAAIDVPGARARRVLTAEDASARPAAVVSFWVDGVDDGPLLAALAGMEADAYEVTEHERWDDAEPTLSRWVFIVRGDGISRDDFVRRYEHHATLARVHHPSICRYVQDVITRAVTPGAAPFDGVSELGFWDREAMVERHYDSPEGRAVITADVDGFLDRRRSVPVLGAGQ